MENRGSQSRAKNKGIKNESRQGIKGKETGFHGRNQGVVRGEEACKYWETECWKNGPGLIR